VNNNELFLIMFWILTLWDFFLQILIVNKDQLPKNKIFIFLEYWPKHFGIYKHVKSKMQENNYYFFVFKKSILKHIFEISNTYFFK
jgi:hypothetical protein